jgi:hypothetical protein
MALMDADIRIDARVVLNTFLGTAQPASPPKRDNYWRLVGGQGTIVDADDAHAGGRHAHGRRVLVRFDAGIAAAGLDCHNPVPDSLWIFVQDLGAVVAT